MSVGLEVATAVAFIFAGSATLFLMPQWIGRLLSFCVILMFIDVAHFTVHGAQIRIYQPITLCISIVAILQGLFRGTHLPLLKISIVYTALTVLSLAWTIDPKDTEVVAFGQLYLILLLLAVLFAIKLNYVTVDRLLRALAIGAFLSSLAAVLEFVAALGGVHVQTFRVVGIPWPRPAGLMTEPDWAALVAGIGFFLAYFELKRGTFRRLAVAVNAITLIVTAARAVWVSLILLAIIMLFSKERIRRFAARLVPVMVLVVAGVTAFAIAKPNELTRLSPNNVLSSNGSGDEGSANSRLGVVHLIESQTSTEPVYGFGAGSLAQTVDLPANQLKFGGGGQLNEGHGDTNLELTSLWDGGWILLGIIVLLLLAWLRCAWRCSARWPGLFPVSVLLFLDFQFNNGFRFAFVWVVMGLCAVGATVPAQSPVEVDGPGGSLMIHPRLQGDLAE
jgi:hypothetical protein